MKDLLMTIGIYVILGIVYYLLKEFVTKEQLAFLCIIETGLLYPLFMEHVNRM